MEYLEIDKSILKARIELLADITRVTFSSKLLNDLVIWQSNNMLI